MYLEIFHSYSIELLFKNQIRNQNLNVHFRGYLDGELKENLLRVSDILVLPSYAEGFPMVIPEAMAFGCAIISTNVAGIPDIVRSDYNGFLLEPGQISELTDKILYFGRNRDILKKFQEKSLELSMKYTIKEYINQLSQIYKA